jgi:ABC-type multidrug transport system fused ATPase/permease subunit
MTMLGGILATTIGLQLLSPQIVRLFIDAAISGRGVTVLVGASVAYLASSLCLQALLVLETYVAENVGWSATNALRVDLTRHCLDLDMTFHNAHTPGEMIERIDGDATTLSNFFSRFVALVIGNLLLLAGVLTLLIWENWRAGLSLTAFTLVTIGVLSASRHFAVPAFAAERQASAELYGFLEERLAGLVDVRANGAIGYVMSRFHQAMRKLYRATYRSFRRGSITWQATSLLLVASNVAILAFGVSFFKAGAITIGTVYLWYRYTQMLRNPLEELMRQLQDFQRASAGITRIRQLLLTVSAVREEQSEPSATLPSGPLSIAFDRVTFGYHRSEPVLHNVTWSLHAGDVLGVVGRTGSGKTTLSRLLFRLYDPWEGEIRLGGTLIRDVRLRELRRKIAIVTQDVQLFRASVRDNLTLFDPSVTDERLLFAIQALELTSWFARLPDGLDTELGAGGSGASAGEAQLLALCRAFLRDPGLVILDEASSRLDPATERLIERTIDRLLHGRTAIIIAHRLATIDRADDVLALEEGRVREHGPRARLADDPGSLFFAMLTAVGKQPPNGQSNDEVALGVVAVEGKSL